MRREVKNLYLQAALCAASAVWWAFVTSWLTHTILLPLAFATVAFFGVSFYAVFVYISKAIDASEPKRHKL